MRIQTQFNIFSWYNEIKKADRPVAWCSAFAPVEFLMAAGVTPVFPENHAVMLGALGEIRRPYSVPAIEDAESSGLKSPQLCSYALSDLGTLLGNSKSPIHGLPKPNLFYACDSQCRVVERWGDQVQDILSTRDHEIPHYVLRAPSLAKKEEHSQEELDHFQSQIERHIQDICRRLGTTFSESRLKEVTAESERANKLWQQCLELAKLCPAPWSNTDAFAAMAPIVVARGTKQCTEYYQKLYDELSQRVKNKIEVVPGERIRLLWDAIPIWPRRNWLADFAARHQAVFVVSTYTHSWWFKFDPEDAVNSLVKRYAWNTMNRSSQWILDWTLELAREYDVDGIVSHWNMSCGIWNSYVKRRLPGYKNSNLPHLVIKADMVDARAFDEETISRQLSEFFEQLS
ncbi:MAG: 2-hydroxyacyl-CoA dehydratase [SAR324 cluster bacterium]|nr:2-hydroxyacyl-CoA dehydratase [SAR324 cluster bacterium]